MIAWIAWISALAVACLMCLGLGNTNDFWSCLCAAGIVWTTFQITARFKVASRSSVSKMSTAWLTQEVRRMVWRMLLTLILASLLFRLMYPTWGIAYWLSVACFYQVGLLLHLRVIRQSPSNLSTPGPP